MENETQSLLKFDCLIIQFFDWKIAGIEKKNLLKVMSFSMINFLLALSFLQNNRTCFLLTCWKHCRSPDRLPSPWLKPIHDRWNSFPLQKNHLHHLPKTIIFLSSTDFSKRCSRLVVENVSILATTCMTFLLHFNKDRKPYYLVLNKKIPQNTKFPNNVKCWERNRSEKHSNDFFC